jgi:hypothetical protein
MSDKNDMTSKDSAPGVPSPAKDKAAVCDGEGTRRGGSRCFDRQGQPMELMEWARAMENQEYKRVAETTLPDGKWVSTVWLGLDHNFGGGPPLIFETMVFESPSGDGSLDQDRYSTEAGARAGHEAMVAKWLGGGQP